MSMGHSSIHTNFSSKEIIHGKNYFITGSSTKIEKPSNNISCYDLNILHNYKRRGRDMRIAQNKAHQLKASTSATTRLKPALKVRRKPNSRAKASSCSTSHVSLPCSIVDMRTSPSWSLTTIPFLSFSSFECSIRV